MREIKVGGLYKHFKGHKYRIVRIGYDSEKYDESNPDASRVVVYENINDSGDVWVRPYDMFNSKVDKEKYPDVNQEYRFEEIKEEKLC